jgi:hypothetical protein
MGATKTDFFTDEQKENIINNEDPDPEHYIIKNEEIKKYIKQIAEIKYKTTVMKAEKVKINLIKSQPNNPRLIKDDKFKKLVQSLKSFPEMAKVRPIVVNTDMIVLGGNMRLKAMKEAGWKEVPIEIVDWDEEKQREFIIKDNIGYGEWDWAMIQNEWDTDQLIEWGMDVIGFDLDADKLGTDFTLPDGDKAPFQQMTFTLADEQAEIIKNALADMKATDEYKYAETMGNENSNGNALYLIVAAWAGQKI